MTASSAHQSAFTIAIGKRSFKEMALNLASSIRRNCPNLHCTIVTDEDLNLPKRYSKTSQAIGQRRRFDSKNTFLTEQTIFAVAACKHGCVRISRGNSRLSAARLLGSLHSQIISNGVTSTNHDALSHEILA
jgi:hypothetical protein